MNTQEFLDVLKTHQDKALLFEYAPGMIIPANYHITEIKNTLIESVDCGAGTDNWNETVIQLWESPSEIGKTTFLSCAKALSILNKVNRIRSMDKDAVVKFEYGNAIFHTSVLHVLRISIAGSNLVIHLSPIITDCKAKETCGVPEYNTATQESCAPGSGCC